MNTKKILLLLLSIALILSFATSCKKAPKTAEEAIEMADSALLDKAYSVDIDVDYRADDAAMAGIFEQLERMDIVAYFDGSNMKTVTDLSIDYGEGDTRFVSTYTAVDGMLYLDMTYTYGDISDTLRNKAVISAEQIDTLYGELSLVGDITARDFESVTMEKQGDEYVISCDKISNEKLISLEKALLSQLESTADTVKATAVKMTAEIDDGKYESITVDCEYKLTMGGKTYVIGMTVELDFDYGESFEITAPSDVHEYTNVNFEDIV